MQNVGNNIKRLKKKFNSKAAQANTDKGDETYGFLLCGILNTVITISFLSYFKFSFEDELPEPNSTYVQANYLVIPHQSGRQATVEVTETGQLQVKRQSFFLV